MECIHKTYVCIWTKETPEEMIKKGYKPVGKDFPVFLHPDTHEEYALARTERKIAKGYKGFEFHTSPDVSLLEDLKRRDLTINAIAQSTSGAHFPCKPHENALLSTTLLTQAPSWSNKCNLPAERRQTTPAPIIAPAEYSA